MQCCPGGDFGISMIVRDVLRAQQLHEWGYPTVISDRPERALALHRRSREERVAQRNSVRDVYKRLVSYSEHAGEVETFCNLNAGS
jgi:hypothetical protein